MAKLARLGWVAAVGFGLLSAGCGGDSPTSSSGSGGVRVEGVMLGAGASVSAADTSSSRAARKVTVKIEGTSLTVDVSANGTFQFTGVPSGTFTLVFMADGVEIGRVVVSAADGSEVKIVVQVQDSALVVIDIKVEAADPTSTPPTSGGSCGVNGGTAGQGIELEGNVQSGSSAAFKLAVNGRASFPIDVNAGSASFNCVGNAKTTSDAECKASVKPGAKVHVRGTLASCASSSAQVTASEVKVQKG